MRRRAAAGGALALTLVMVVLALRALPTSAGPVITAPAPVPACGMTCGWLRAPSRSVYVALSRIGAAAGAPCRPIGRFVRRADAKGCSAGLRVAGNQLLDGAGTPVRLRGVVRSGTEYMCSEGYGIFDGPSGAGEFQAMARWGIDTVFIGLNEDCWLGINGVPSADAGQNYIAAIRTEVSAAESAGLYPVVGFFWGDPGAEVPRGQDPNGGGQPPLPDNDHAPLFWEEVANVFKHDPSVALRLQEEPHPSHNATDLSAWECWSRGDVQYGPSSDQAPPLPPTPRSAVRHCAEQATDGITSYQTVGMQSLIDIIRGTGARNVIQVPGLAYANLLSCSPLDSPISCGFLDTAHGVAVHDTLSRPQLMADVDVYPDSGQICASVSCYETSYAPVAAIMPLDGGEVGPNGAVDTNTNAFLDWMDAHHAGYYAWAWDTWSALISSYAGTPDTPWGTDYQRRLEGVAAAPPSRSAAGITLTAEAAPCTNPPTNTVAFPYPVKAGDDLFLVTGGAGYTGPASTVSRVSDEVNGTWSRLANTGSRSGGSQESVSYAVYEVVNSRPSPRGLAIRVDGQWGQSGMSTIVLDASGVAGIGATAFDTSVQPQTKIFTGPQLTSRAGDVVVGLYANYSHAGDEVTAPPAWHADTNGTVNTSNCAGAAIDWTEPNGEAPLAARLTDSVPEYHFGGAIDLQPRSP